MSVNAQTSMKKGNIVFMNRMPVIFFGHGNPLNALGGNRYAAGWSSVSRSLPRPRAVLSVSAHYYVPFHMVTANAHPPTIHDVSGFPEDLYHLNYPAPGSPELARRIKELLVPDSIIFDDYWGLDHGTWSVLMHVFPEADIPVVQFSINEKQPAKFHYQMAKRLRPLREEGVLIIGSGNLVHNLAAYQWRNRDMPARGWAARFEQWAREMLFKGDNQGLLNYGQMGEDAAMAVPTPDHYLPFIYALGLRRPNDSVSFPVQGMDGGSVSMLSVRFG